MNLASFSVRNPVCINLIMATILIMGVVLYVTRMPKEIFPAFSQDIIQVTTVYGGASAREMEKNVSMKIEDAVADLEDIEDIFSTSQEGRSTVRLEVSKEVSNTAKLLNDVQQAIDQIDDLPEDAEDPVVQELDSDLPIITVSLYGGINLLELERLVEDLEDAIAAVPGVANVNRSGLPEREVWVEIRPETIKQYTLTLQDVTRILDAQNYDLPGGTMDTTGGAYLLRTKGKAATLEDLREVVVATGPNGGQVVLDDIATLRDWFADKSTLGRFNRQRAINLSVFKNDDGDAIKITQAITKVTERFEGQLPPTVQIGLFNDLSVYIKNRLDVLKTSGFQGLIVVFILLLLALNTRVAGLVTLGIPVSFLGAIVLMYYVGMTMNMIAMFALIVVLGLVVDDAVVIGENVYRHYEQGLSPAEAAVRGASEVSWPVVSAVATTIAAFLPMLLIPGTMGVFLGVIPKVVTFALLVSLLEALVILPSHLAEFLPARPKPPSRLRRKLNAGVDSAIDVYGRFLDLVLEWRYVFLTAVISFSAVLIVYSAVHLPFILFGEFEGAQFYVNVECPLSFSLEDTEEYIKQVEERLAETIPEAELISLVTNVGTIMDDMDSFRSGPHLGQIIVELKEFGKGRDRPIKVVSSDVRDALADLQRGGRHIEVQELQSGPGGKPIYILVTGPRLDVLQEISFEIQNFVSQIPGVRDLSDNLEPGKTEFQVELTPLARTLGLSERDVAWQLRSGFAGIASTTSMQSAAEDIDIRVRFPEAVADRVETLYRMHLRLPGGELVPLSEVARVAPVRGESAILRDNGQRSVAITGDLDQAKTTASDVAQAVQDRFGDVAERFPGYRLTTQRGEVQDINRSMTALKFAFLLALFLIYFILGTQFRSYVQPLIVMAAIPLGIDGVLLGHILTGKQLGILSMIGLVALSGIVVNDSLVLVDFVNRLRRQGQDRRSSLVQAGMIRFRPVLLTSLTTMGGLFFLAFLAKGQAQFLSPMAVSIFFGLMMATIITLFVVPAMYSVTDDVALHFRRRRRETV